MTACKPIFLCTNIPLILQAPDKVEELILGIIKYVYQTCGRRIDIYIYMDIWTYGHIDISTYRYVSTYRYIDIYIKDACHDIGAPTIVFSEAHKFWSSRPPPKTDLEKNQTATTG